MPPTFTSKSSRTRARDGSPRRRGRPTRRSTSVEQRVDHDRVAYVADDDLDPRVDDLEQRRVARLVHEAADALAGSGCAASARTRFWPEPARGAGDDDRRGAAGRGRFSGSPSRTVVDAIASFRDAVNDRRPVQSRALSCPELDRPLA